MAAKAFECKASTDGSSLDLMMYGAVGTDYYGDGSRIDARNVAKSLNANKSAKTINLQVNSPGGDFFHAMAIYSALKAHGAKVVAIVQGLAASAMTVICGAADEINMADGGLFMIHEARTGVEGTADEMQAVVDVTKKINEQIVNVYAARTGKKPEELAKMMKDETWMTAEEAKANGFVTSIAPMKTMVAMLQPEQRLNVPEHIKPILALLEGEPPVMADSVTSTAVVPPVTATAPAAPVVQVVAPAAPVAAPAADPVATAVAAATARATSIFSACMLAGKPELAPAFVADSAKSVDQVLAAMQIQFVAERQAKDAGGAGGAEPPAADPNKAFEAEYTAQADAFSEMGITKEQFIASRRVDAGLEKLSLKK